MNRNLTGLKGSLLVSISGISFGFLPVFARFIYNTGLDTLEMLFFRFLIASIFLALFLYYKKILFIPNYKILLSLFLLGGLGYFTQSMLYLSSIKYIPISIAVLLLYLYPTIVSSLSFLLKIEKFTMRIAIALVMSVSGLFLITGPGEGFSLYGLVLALGSAFVYAGYIIGSSKVLRKIEGETASLYVMASATMSFLVFSMVTKGNVEVKEEALLWIFLMALVSTTLAITAFFSGLRLIGPSRASIISILEPLTSIFLSFILFGEEFSAIQAAGALFIIVAVLISFKTRSQYTS